MEIISRGDLVYSLQCINTLINSLIQNLNENPEEISSEDIEAVLTKTAEILSNLVN